MKSSEASAPRARPRLPGIEVRVREAMPCALPSPAVPRADLLLRDGELPCVPALVGSWYELPLRFFATRAELVSTKLAPDNAFPTGWCVRDLASAAACLPPSASVHASRKARAAAACRKGGRTAQGAQRRSVIIGTGWWPRSRRSLIRLANPNRWRKWRFGFQNRSYGGEDPGDCPEFGHPGCRAEGMFCKTFIHLLQQEGRSLHIAALRSR